LRSKFDTRAEVLDEKIVMALKFAAITNVDDDTNVKGAIEKRGRKSIFSDIKTKIEALKQELIANGAKKEGVEIKLNTYQNVFEVLLAISENTNGKFTILGSYIKFENNIVFAKLNNPPKQTELISDDELVAQEEKKREEEDKLEEERLETERQKILEENIITGLTEYIPIKVSSNIIDASPEKAFAVSPWTKTPTSRP
jgi:hypothetical protein